MMLSVYNFFIRGYAILIKAAALSGNKKAALWLSGRKDWYKNLDTALGKYSGKERYWFHCASLGEFEQGRPLIEKIRKEFPDAFILLTFFSPSGYEIRKNYDQVNYVSYLPLDTKKNARSFIQLVAPTKIIFIKYEFWFHFINEGLRNCPVYIASAIFRPPQIFFKWYGTFFRNLLKKITHIFLQDKNSQHLLSEIGISNCSIAGDTRFDRVQKVAGEIKSIPSIKDFTGGQKTIVAGSTWPEDEDLLLKVFYALENKIKLVIVPHEVSPERIRLLKEKIIQNSSSTEVSLYSEKTVIKNSSIFIVDTIGILSSAYQYATITWVGGGFGNGIHNILEPAAHGKPVFFGPNYKRFREAHELIACQSAFSVNDFSDAIRLIQKLLQNENALTSAGSNAADYVAKNTGATESIFHFIFNRDEKKKAGVQQKFNY